MPRRRTIVSAARALIVFSLAAGCTGQIGAELSPGGGPSDPPDRTARPGGEASPGSAPQGPAVPGAGTLPAAGPLVRISPTQLDNIARDLFGVGAPPATDFPAIATDDTKLDLQPLVKAHLAAAELIGTRAFADGGPFSGTCAAAVDRACAERFVTAQGRLLFRRAVAPEEKTALLRLYDGSAGLGGRDALRRVLVGMLVSTPFLYRLELQRGAVGGVGNLSAEEIATRMAFAAWSSGPTGELLDLAAGGGLDTGPRRAAQLEAMLKSEKGGRMSRDLIAGWLGTRKVTEIRKDGVAAKGFSSQVAAALAEETERFAAATFTGPSSSFTELLTAGHSYLNDALKVVYGVGGTRGAELERVTLPAGQRSGLLTHGSVLAVHTNPVEASPVERGVFVYETLLCQGRPEVPVDVPPLPPAESNGRRLTQRERLEQHRSAPQCRVCHEIFDGYGLALEQYDLIGRYVEREGDTPLTGEAVVAGLDGKTQRFRGAIDLGRTLAASPTARACFVEKVHRLSTGLTPEQLDPVALDRVAGYFQTSGDMRRVLVDMVTDPSFVSRRF